MTAVAVPVLPPPGMSGHRKARRRYTIWHVVGRSNLF